MPITKVKANTTEAYPALAFEISQRCIARAPDGTLWIIYNDNVIPTQNLFAAYSTDDGLTWTEELITAAEDVPGYRALALMVDSGGVPHIIYEDTSVSPVRIQYRNRLGGIWGPAETVHQLPGVGAILTIKAAIDSADTIHILWDDNVSMDTNYITGVAGAWSALEMCDPALGLSDIGINSSDEPIAVFYDYLRLRAGGVWGAPDIFDPGANSLYGAVLCVDSVDDYHVAWDNGWATWDIQYRKKEGGVWLAPQAVGDLVELYAQPVLVLDTNNNAYCVYQHMAGTAFSEYVWYNQISGNVVGAQIEFDTTILQPNARPSVYTGLFHRYPNSGILPASLCPTVALLDETPAFDADIYFEQVWAVVAPTVTTNPATEVT